MTRSRFAGALFIALAMMLSPVACSDGPTGLAGDDAQMVMTASVVGTPIATLVVEITAADIAVPVVFNLTVVNGIATGTLRMPPGEDRLITVRAFDTFGEITHEGSKTVDVQRGNGNPAVSIPMVARSGHIDITIQIGPVSVVVTPSAATVAAGGTVQLDAIITAPNGDEIEDPVSWATTNPAFATVDASGLVTGVRAGSASMVASYAGVAAISSITVTPTDQNLAPTANAGADRLVAAGAGTTVTLNGSGSDPEGASLTFAWTLAYASPGTSAPATLAGASPTFPAPADIATIEYDLVVSDGVNSSVADRVSILSVADPARAVFVSLGGDDSNPGTVGQPKRHIGPALTQAAALGPGAGVYAAAGTFDESPSLLNGVSVYGGYDASWRRDWAAHHTIVSANAGGTRAINANGIVLDGLRLHSADATVAGSSSYALFMNGSAVTLRNVTLVAGDGADGQDGAPGATGAGGAAGTPGQPGCFQCSAGGQGGFLAGAGAGGLGGYDGPGIAGFSVVGGGSGGAGGQMSLCGGSPATPGGFGSNGLGGSAGGFGTGGASGTAVSTGYLPGSGSAGASGTPGTGGGGGGGGGGGDDLAFLGCLGDRAGGGGSGGAGGAGGGGGGPGGGGGGSFGVFAFNSSVTLTNVSITTGDGGIGGDGGVGGAGGAGGLGGLGGVGRGDAAEGGRGGSGGGGGSGGSGGGGGGGPSVGVFRFSSSLTQSLVTYTLGNGGPGGIGPGAAGEGTQGIRQETHFLP